MGICFSTSSHGCCNTDSSCCTAIGLDGRLKPKKAFPDHVSLLQHLPSIPNRIVTNGKSQSSCIFTQQGRKGINQDAMVVWEDFMSEDVIFCGVFDGHGPHGHLVARKVRDALPIKLMSFLDSCNSKPTDSGGACFKSGDESVESERRESMETKSDAVWRETFLKSYKAMDKELRSHPTLDCFCSGSTAVTIVKHGSNLFIGNIGDSRAVLGSKDGGGSFVAIQLTVDLKPDLPREAERIKRCKGRVFALQDEPEVPRVWLPFDDAPGLAMARAFGDFCLKDYGVISVPEFSHRTLTENDEFVVLASDGVWDVLSNEEVVEIVSSAPSRSLAARNLVESAGRQWRLKYPTSKMDDCAVVCLFLDGKVQSDSDCEEQGCCSASLQSNQCGDDVVAAEPCLQRNYTLRGSGNEGTEENWSGLEGVTRVNSLVQLPRFSGERKKALNSVFG